MRFELRWLRSRLPRCRRATVVFLTCAAILPGCGSEDPAGPAPPADATSVQLRFSVQPSDGLSGSVIRPQIEVQILDAVGGVVVTATNAVRVEISTNAGGSTLSGTTTVNASAGTASFDNLSLDRVGAGYTLIATSGSLASATSSQFDITHQLVVTVQPASVELNATITPTVRVEIQDGAGNLVPSATDPVTLSLGDNPAGGTLLGTTSVNAVAGAAEFPDLSIDKVGDGYTLVAAGGALLEPATSAALDVGFTLAALESGTEHTCALQVTGNAYCWGGNEDGQLGDGSNAENRRPVLVSGGHTWAGVSAGFRHTCGLTTDNVTYCWGYNGFGQLGDGTTADHSVPELVAGDLVMTVVSAGGGHSCAVASNGWAYCWGINFNGQLGIGDVSMGSSDPLPVQGGRLFTTLRAGAGHACGVTTGGESYCWGFDNHGQLGDGNVDSRSPAPTLVLGGLEFTSLTTGNVHTCGLTSDGTAYCWGLNTEAQLGSVGMIKIPTPVAVPTELRFAALTAGTNHTCGLTADGTAYCWGGNGSGQLGDGTMGIGGPSPEPVLGGLTFVALSAGAEHTCGLIAEGVAYCWGSNNSGQLGDGVFNARSEVPVRVLNPA